IAAKPAIGDKSKRITSKIDFDSFTSSRSQTTHIGAIREVAALQPMHVREAGNWPPCMAAVMRSSGPSVASPALDRRTCNDGTSTCCPQEQLRRVPAAPADTE